MQCLEVTQSCWVIGLSQGPFPAPTVSIYQSGVCPMQGRCVGGIDSLAHRGQFAFSPRMMLPLGKRPHGHTLAINVG